MSKSWNFNSAIKHLVEQASRALSFLFLFLKIRFLKLPFDCLFNKVSSLILLYSCEVWEYENIDMIEKVYSKYLKFILHVNLKSSTPKLRSVKSVSLSQNFSVMSLQNQYLSKIFSEQEKCLYFSDLVVSLQKH